MELLLKAKASGLEMKLESHTSEFRKAERWGEFMMQARGALEFAKIEMKVMEVAVDLLCCVRYPFSAHFSRARVLMIAIDGHELFQGNITR